MTNYAKELHEKLLEYSALEHILEDNNVEKIRALGFNAINLSGIIIDKTSEPLHEGGSALITITEIEPLGDEAKLIRTTDYVRHTSGQYSDVDQNSSIISDDQLSNITLLKAAFEAVADYQDEYVNLEKSKASDKDLINCELRLTAAVGEAYKILSEEDSFKKSLGDYGPQEHQDLLQKLGALVLDLDAFYGPKN